MAFNITADTQRIYAVNIGSTDGGSTTAPNTQKRLASTFTNGYTNMASATKSHFCIFVNWRVGCPNTDEGQKAVFTFYNGTSNHHALIYQWKSTGPEFNWQIAGSNGLRKVTLPASTNLNGKWVTICMSYFRRSSASLSRAYMRIKIHETGTWYDVGTQSVGTIADPANAVPTNFSFGSENANVSGSKTAEGIKAVYVIDEPVWDGTSRDGIATLNADTILAAGWMSPLGSNLASLQWACGHASTGSTFAGAVDCRMPDNAANSTIPIYDRFNVSFPRYFDIGGGGTVSGTIPIVNPYEYNWTYPVRANRTVNTSETASAFPALTADQVAYGTKGLKTAALCDHFNGRASTRTVRTAVWGNSRAVWSLNAALVTTDRVRVAGRSIPTNYNEYGFLANPNLWSGLVVGVYLPALGYDGSSVDATASYGFDASPSGIYCKDGAGSSVSPSVAFESYLNNSLGSMGGWATRNTTLTDGDAESFRGNGHHKRLKPDYSARWLVRPELGMPVTEALRVGVVIRNCALSSIPEVRKARATSQTASPVSLSSPVAGAWTTFPTNPGNKTIAAKTDPVYVDKWTPHSPAGTITVDDTGGQWSDLQVGDLLLNSTSNDQLVVAAVNRSNPAAMVITYDWRGATHPQVGNTVTWLDARYQYTVVEVDFAANEAASGEWRGIEIKASANAGEIGCLIAGVYAYVPDKAGVIMQSFGRSGCGAEVQQARFSTRASARDGKTELQRIMDILQTDVMFMSRFDQGTASGHYHTSYSLAYDKVVAARPSLEVVFAGSGPECQEPNDYASDHRTADAGHAAALDYVARQKGKPSVSWYFDATAGVANYERYATGVDIGESATHPLCSEDVRIWMAQLDALETVTVPRRSATTTMLLLLD